METKTPRIYTGNVRFPEALHGLLEDAEPVQFEHIISWLPCGMGFKIHDHKAFGSQIMPKYFLATALKSFKRNLSLYSFQKITVGPNKGAYMHTHFMRNQPGQCRQIKRQQQHKTQSANNNKNSPTLEQHEEDVKHEKSKAEVFAMDIPFEAEPAPRDSSLILNEEIGCDLSNNAASFLTSQKAAILHGHTTETNTLESLLLLNEEIGSDFMLAQSNHAASHLTSQKAAIPQQLLNEEIGCDFMFAQSNNAASHLTSQRAHMPQGLTTCTSTSPSATVHHSSDEQSRAFNRNVASMMTVPDSPPLLDRSFSLDLSSEIIKTFNFS